MERRKIFSRAEQSRAEQSRAEQSRAEQSRAEQSRAEQSRMTNMIMTYIKHPAVGIVRFRTISTVGCFCFVD